ncbi:MULTISPECIES: GNAT family N-acetyltransferase [Brevibacillus]|uniref:GNAT family N-acetyltransferase n=1 Tax=Brevibacillus TaxID=55080 RepID=UPI000D113BFC|nr:MULTISPECIES: GNAT family N-acetyltransferase [Brevibacillus]MED1943914.1 GNAT family N-acetyltransferase [Brevibacillus formosus]MED1999714.1 GNAT family N-acetyltransferase [Brevibacillus formosus]MED2082149.1 GNAT family N-acetyltransferase [Brevibacillus formosus]PSK18921.1 N-acetyltransferase [Brevibacillus sp. NRRL NRS-603]
MDIFIRELRAGDEECGTNIDGSFIVDSTLVLQLMGQRIGYTVKEIPLRIKSYDDEQLEEDTVGDYSNYIDNPDQIIYVALANNQVVGQIVLKRNWNKYAYVEDIKVDKQYRGYGVGKKLIEQAKRWAMDGGMTGIMLETQNNNVRACKFYESCGFVIGGFDSYVYRGLDKNSDEIAIYWYLILD